MLFRAPSLPPHWQRRLQGLLGVLTLALGFHTIWLACSSASSNVALVLAVTAVSVVAGRVTGAALGLQTRLNGPGQFAGRVLNPGSGPAGNPAPGEVFRAATVVFCATPLALLGVVQAAWGGDERLLFLKAAVDGLATLALVRTVGGWVVAGALPVLALQGSLWLGLKALAPHVHPFDGGVCGWAVSGFLLLPVALVMLQVVRVRLADYLPALVWAPFLAWLVDAAGR